MLQKITLIHLLNIEIDNVMCSTVLLLPFVYVKGPRLVRNITFLARTLTTRHVELFLSCISVFLRCTGAISLAFNHYHKAL